MTMLINPFRFGGGGGGGSGTLIFGAGRDFSSGSTATTVALPIGAADPDRWVIAGIYANFNTGRTLGSVTIGGVSATLMYATPDLGGSDGSRVEYWKANVPTGTTAVLSFSTTTGTFYDGLCCLWYTSAEPLFSAGAFDNTYSSNTKSVTIDVPEGGAVIAMDANPGAAGRTVTAISGVVLDVTSLPYSTAGASEDELSAETGRTVSVTWNVVAGVPRFFGLGVMSISF